MSWARADAMRKKAWISSVPCVFGYLLVQLYAAQEANIIEIIIFFQVCRPSTIFQAFVKFLQCVRRDIVKSQKCSGFLLAKGTIVLCPAFGGKACRRGSRVVQLLLEHQSDFLMKGHAIPHSKCIRITSYFTDRK